MFRAFIGPSSVLLYRYSGQWVNGMGRHPSSLSSTIGPPHSHFVNRLVVTKRLTYGTTAVAFVNDISFKILRNLHAQALPFFICYIVINIAKQFLFCVIYFICDCADLYKIIINLLLYYELFLICSIYYMCVIRYLKNY